MKLFDFFKPQNNRSDNQKDHSLNVEGTGVTEQIGIPKAVFVEDKEPEEQLNQSHFEIEANGLGAIYDFLQADDYELRGYDDALTSSDDNYRSNNIKLIKRDLQILIERVNHDYENLLRDLDYHISSRSRAGLIDLVEQLNTRKDMVRENMSKIEQIKAEMERDEGMAQRIILSYQRGFMRGLSALTLSSVMNQKL